jgi:glycerol-3-phosphate dehydrogenase
VTSPRSAGADPFDIAIVGAGVVGCAVFRELVLAGARCVLVERDADILAGASKGNSAILHTGFDATPGTLEARLVAAGYHRYREIRERLGLPLLASGAVVVAWTAEEETGLPAIVARAGENGVAVRTIDAAELRAREPGLAADARAGVMVPGEALIDPWSAPLAYVLQGLENGGTVMRSTAVTGGTLADGMWTLATTAGTVTARVVVNCAGNHGDIVEAIARPSPFAIRPRKGQFVVFDKSAFGLVHAIVLPVPTERTKGVVVCRTVFGNLLVGPTAEDQDERSVATVEQAALEALTATGRRIVPALAEHEVTAIYAGLRPATQFKDYQIEALPERRWITVAGIRSTGLTGSLGIAEHVRGLYEEHFSAHVAVAEPRWTPVPNLAYLLPRAAPLEGRSTIVCHCEMVTQAAIERALGGPLPAATLGGLKRRTRCMMGRCQGFYCTRRVMELAAGRIAGLVEEMT